MDEASTNAEELLKDLRVHYNKTRQATITNELMEIVAGCGFEMVRINWKIYKTGICHFPLNKQ